MLRLPLALLLSIFSPPAFAASPSEIVAVVTGVVITRAEFEAEALRKTPANREKLSAEEKQEVLDRLVEEKLLYALALAKGLQNDPKVQKVMVNTLLREDVYANVKNSDFTDGELKSYFYAHKDEFVVPEKVQIKRILIKVTDTRDDEAAKKEASRLRAQIVPSPSTTFKDLAGQFSEDPYRRRGGDLGYVSAEGKPGLPQEIVDKAFTLHVDQVSEVFRTDEGYNVILVAARRERIERTYEQMAGTVLRKVKNDRMKTLYDGYVAKQRSGATVEVNANVLDSIVVESVRRPFAPPGGDAMSPGSMVIPDDAPGMTEPSECDP